MPPSILLSTESASGLDAHYATWFNEYNPTTPELRKLILQAATAEWLLLRLQRHSDKILNPLFELEMANWSPVHHTRYQRTQRLLTAAENLLHKTRRKILCIRQKLRAAARPSPSLAPASSTVLPAQNRKPREALGGELDTATVLRDSASAKGARPGDLLHQLRV
jgi:hypothetical protein